jgi:hypothetical protein
MPPASNIVDGAGNVWTMRSGVIYEGNALAGTTGNVILLLYYGGVIYQENATDAWWYWSSGSWIPTSDPRVATAAAEVVPAAAQTVGYLQKTWGSNPTLVTTPSGAQNAADLYLFNFWGSPGGVTQNSDGTLALNGQNAQVGSAESANTPSRFIGTAFGGGAYFEAVLKFNGWQGSQNSNSGAAGWPAFWGLSIEHLTGQDQWPGQATGYEHFPEVDFFEYDLSYATGTDEIYGGTIHDWYGVWNTTCAPNAFCNIQNSWASVQRPVPSNTDFSSYHAYGLLWVPATATSLGYVQWYFDGAPIGLSVTWPQMPSSPTPAQLANFTFSITDSQHLVVIIDTGANNAMTVQSVSVWQASASNNLTVQ